MPHPDNLWVGEPNEAQVDRLLYAVDQSRGVSTSAPQSPGRAAQRLLLDFTGALPKGDAYETPEEFTPPPPEIA